jgi:uncharacterized protein YjiS (DUF1127 family)
MNASLEHASQRILHCFAAWQRRRYAREICRALRDLDAHTLHDLGLDRSEIHSFAAEMAGDAASTRVRSGPSPARARPDRLRHRTLCMMKQAVMPRVIAAAAAAIIALTLLDQVATMGQSPDAGGAVVLAHIRQWSPDSKGRNARGTPPDAQFAASHQRRLDMGIPTQLQLDIAAAGRTDRTPQCPHVWEARLDAVAAAVRQAYARWNQRRRAADTRRVLEQLDVRTLRDLGVDRSEISSVAAELAGDAEVTRMQVVRGMAGFTRAPSR